MEDKFTISILVSNKPGVLVRMAQTFARRGYNLHSLVVSPTHDPKFSQMTCEVQGEAENFDQILRQLNKLVDVVHAIHHQPDQSIERELALFKIKVDSKRRGEVFQVVEVFRAKTVDFTENSVVIEVTGNSGKIDAMESLLSTYGIEEMVRSGKLVMARGGGRT